MTRKIWPFKPLTDMIEVLEWATDVFQAKSAEQRIALRTAPRRVFNFSHVLTDYQYAGARALMRDAQAADGFLVPDWGQAIAIGEVAAGSAETLTVDLSFTDMGDTALLWESESKYEQVNISYDSAGVVVDPVVNDYSAAYLLPLWNAVCPEGLTTNRIGARLNQCSIAFQVTQNTDLGASNYAQYRSHDVLDTCPVIGGGNFEERIVWPATGFDNGQGIPEYLRSRDIPAMTFQMRWHEFSTAAIWDVRRWLHSRRGRQKVFWFSSFGKDFEPAESINGTTLTTYELPGIDRVGHTSAFDIEVKAKDGTSHYRRVTSATAGAPDSLYDRSTLSLTLDSTLTIDRDDIARISFLRCARFDADRVELLHAARGGVAIQIPCIEVEEP